MKKLLALAAMLLPSFCFADRLGSLRSSADVLLTTQAATVSGVIISTSSLQSGATFFVSSGTVNGPFSVTGGGNGNIQLTISGSTYTVTSSSSGSYSVGQSAVFSSTSGTLIGGTSGVAVGGSGTQIQYRVDATTLGGISNSSVWSSSVTVSTFGVLSNANQTLNTGFNGTSGPGILDIFQGPGSQNQTLFAVGSNAQSNQFYVPNNNYVIATLGLQAGNLVLGNTSATGQRIYSVGDTNSFFDLRNGSTATLNTGTANGPGDIRFQPGSVLTQSLSTQSGTIVYSSFSTVGSGLFNKYGLITSSVQVNQGAATMAGIFSVVPAPGSGLPAYAWEFDTASLGAPLGYLGTTSSGAGVPGGLSIFNNTQNEMMRFGNSSGGVWVTDSGGLIIAKSPSTTLKSAGLQVMVSTASTYAAYISTTNTAGWSVTIDTFGVVSLSSGITTINGLKYYWPSSQSSNYLKNDGSGNLTWAASGATSPGGTTGNVQYNNGTTLGGASNLNIYPSSTVAAGIYISSGINVDASNVVTATTTLTSTMSVVLASCTTRGATPNAWITLTLPTSTAGEVHTIYDVGADSCSIRIAGNGTDLIESSGIVRLDAQTQHASVHGLGSGLWAAGLGGIQYTPWSLFTTQDDVGTFAVASSSLVYACPVYVPIPLAVMGFRLDRVSGTGWISTALTDMNGRYVVGVSTALTVSGVSNYLTGGVTQISPGWYRWEITANNTVVTLSGSNSVNDIKMFCSSVGTDGFGLDLSKFTPTLPGTSNGVQYPAVDLIINGGLQTF